MTTDLDMATHALGHAPSGNKTSKKPKPMKAFHAEELHDGTYAVTKHHGMDEHMMPVRPDEKGSATDIDGVHDHLHEHMGGGGKSGKEGGVSKKGEGPGDGEGEGSHGEENEGAGEKKQGREQKAKHNKDKVDSEEDETPEHGKTDED